MKRLLAVLLSIVYLAAGAGFTLRQHYCMGQHIGTAIDHPVHSRDSHHCARCGMEKKSGDNGCCKDKVKTFRSSPDQIAAKALQAPAAPLAAVLPVLFSLPEATHIAGLSRIAAAPAHGPPGRVGLSLYLQIRCLRL